MSYSQEIESLDDWVTCAYNKNHQMMYRNLANHQLKCRAANPKLAALMDICPYNRTHHVLKEKMEEHFEVCRNYQDVLVAEFREKEDRLLYGHLPSSDPPPNLPETLLKIQIDNLAEKERYHRKEYGNKTIQEWLNEDDDDKLFYDPSKRGAGEAPTEALTDVVEELEQEAETGVAEGQNN